MGRAPCCDDEVLKKGPWTPEEDRKLVDYIQKNGHGRWRMLPNNAGLARCGKSCRLRWTNYLRPDIKRGRFSFEEEEIIIRLHSILGNKWSAIASQLPGRTDNEIKNYWNTHVRKRLLRMGIDPVTHCSLLDVLDLSALSSPHLYINPVQHDMPQLTAGEPPVNLQLAEGLHLPWFLYPVVRDQDSAGMNLTYPSHFLGSDSSGILENHSQGAIDNLALRSSARAMSSPATLMNYSGSTVTSSFADEDSGCFSGGNELFSFQVPGLLDVSNML